MSIKTKAPYFSKLVIFLVLLLSSLVIGAEHDYYADIEIDVARDGVVLISGTTNHPLLIGSYQELTTKNGIYWLLNMSYDEFSNALFKINFPPNTVITYIKTPAQINIGSEGDSPIIKGIIKDKSLEIVVQYYFEDVADKKKNFILIILGTILMMVGLVILYFNKTKSKKKSLTANLPPRQAKIMSLLEKRDGVTQKYLEEQLKWPKSSLSRNIASLERKEFIIKINKGYSNNIFINQKKFK